MEKEFTGAKLFLNIPTTISRDKELLKKPKSILLMGEIISMLNVTGEFFMGNKQLAERLDCSTRMVMDYLDLLESKNLIERKNIYDEKNKKRIIGRKILPGSYLVKQTSLGWRNTLHEGSEADFTRVVKRTSPKKNNIKEQLIEQKNTHSASNDAPSMSDLEKSFNKLWEDYPNKKGKKQAFNHYKAWRKKSVKNTDEYLARKLADYLAYCSKNSDWYHPMNGSTWFNGRFDDELTINKSKVQPENGGFGKEMLAQAPPDGWDDDLPF